MLIIWPFLGLAGQSAQGLTRLQKRCQPKPASCRALTRKGLASKASQVGGRIHFLMAIKVHGKLLSQNQHRETARCVCYTLTWSCECSHVHSITTVAFLCLESSLRHSPYSGKRGITQDVTTGGWDHGNFLKVCLSILNLDPGGFPRLAFLCLTSSFQNFVRTSSLVFSFQEVFSSLLLVTIGLWSGSERWSYPSTAFKDQSSSHKVFQSEIAPFPGKTPVLFIFSYYNTN